MPHEETSNSPTAPHVRVELQSQGHAVAARFCFSASTKLSLLQSAAEAGYVLPSSCRNGSCRACISQLHSGQIVYRIEWPGLLAEEKAAGLCLPCVAFPLTDLVLTVGAGDD